VERLEFFGADVVDDTPEVLLKFTELPFHAFFENLCVNNGVIQINLLSTFLELPSYHFVVGAQANTNLVISKLLQSEAEVALEILDNFICALLGFMHHLKELVEF
jgi:hypothetical protein